MERYTDLAGMVFDRLTVVERTGTTIRGRSAWRCRCACGQTRVADRQSLLDGHVKSCGCLKKALKHGLHYTPERRAWQAMKNRCYNPNATGFALWGGRGIRVCERWRNSLESFVEDMGLMPPLGTLERIDNDGDYSPGNCRWANRREQAQNTRRNQNIQFEGRTQCIAEWAREIGIPGGTLWARFKNGWGTERALTTPLRGH